MGCGLSTEEKEGKMRNEEIDNQLKRDKMLQRNEIKMLLLGSFFLLPHPPAGSILFTNPQQEPVSRASPRFSSR
jgi:hypothetical protein